MSEAPDDSVQILKNYGRDVGIAFQIVDDILDFISTEEELGKPAGSDLTQGTLTLPAMILNERYPRDNPIKRLFLNPNDPNELKLALEQVRNSSIVDECYKLAKEYCDKACRQIINLPSGIVRQSLLDLADFVVIRKS